MSLIATVVDPLVEPPPPAWDEFVSAQRLLPMWDSQLLRVAAWSAQTPSSMVLVCEASSSEPVALFHARHLGPGRSGRFARPGRVPLVSVTECRSAPMVGTGVAFAGELSHYDRAEAVRVFELAVGRRVGLGGRAIVYRHLTHAELAVIPRAGRRLIQVTPDMVLDNQWPDLAGYLAELPSKLRNRLRTIRGRLDADSIVVGLTATIKPAEASWLVHAVEMRHRLRGPPRPPCPAGYFERFSQLPGSRYLTYHTADGRLIAFVTMYDDGTDLIAGIWGRRDPTDGGRRDLYFDLYLQQVDWLVGSGRRRLRFGRGMAEIKARFGARMEARWGLLGVR
jgi:hypothetical protein